MSSSLTSFLNNLANRLPSMKKLMLAADIAGSILKILSPVLFPTPTTF